MKDKPMRCFLRHIAIALVTILVLIFNVSCTKDQAQSRAELKSVSYLPLIKSHLDKLIAKGRDEFGSVHTDMWSANISTETGEPVKGDHIPERVYRLIGAPRGSSLYWDQPLIVSAYILSEITGEEKYGDSATAYIEDFLKTCVDQNGMFAWGNHQYYDIFEDKVVKFHDGYHEIRPITPAWELFRQRDPGKCSRYIRVMAERHVYDSQTGGFNRHDDGEPGHPFLEAGAVLVESLAWLYQKENDPDLLTLALRIAEFSYSHRGEKTGLLRNSPGSERWDDYALTTEVGLWAQSLLRAAKYTSENRFFEMARDAVGAYLRYGYDPEECLYYGQLNVMDGTPVEPDEKGYWPGKYADIWNNDQWPTHDYPMSLAEACLTLYEATEEKLFFEGVNRWVNVVKSQTPACDGNGTYAENYGRCIHFLARAGRTLNDPDLLIQARMIADEAIAQLYENGMFQGFPDSHLYESVDGVGFLCLALISLEYNQMQDYMGFGF
jgi:Periplasmic pectate lyase